jgi:hypothetical protein
VAGKSRATVWTQNAQSTKPENLTNSQVFAGTTGDERLNSKRDANEDPLPLTLGSGNNNNPNHHPLFLPTNAFQATKLPDILHKPPLRVNMTPAQETTRPEAETTPERVNPYFERYKKLLEYLFASTADSRYSVTPQNALPGPERTRNHSGRIDHISFIVHDTKSGTPRPLSSSLTLKTRNKRVMGNFVSLLIGIYVICKSFIPHLLDEHIT